MQHIQYLDSFKEGFSFTSINKLFITIQLFKISQIISPLLLYITLLCIPNSFSVFNDLVFVWFLLTFQDFHPKKMNDYDGNFMDDLSPLSSPRIREALAMLDQNENGLNPISKAFPQTHISPDPQSEQRSGGLRNRMVGFDIPSLEIESISPFANSFRNPILVLSPILVISPGFSLSPFLQSPNMLSHSSSQVSNNLFNKSKIDLLHVIYIIVSKNNINI